MFIDSQGFATVEDFNIMAVKDVPYTINNHNSIHQQSVILGAVHQRKIQVLIHWARDQKRRGIAIVPGNWDNAALANDIERVNSETPSKEVERPGKLEVGINGQSGRLNGRITWAQYLEDPVFHWIM